MKRKEEKQERTIRVRDRRSRYQFSIHNRIIDEWFPIIGAPGYALYGLYSRMANKADERCWTAYSTIQSHMRMGPGTISDYNKLLVWCDLIHIEEGDTRLANDYYILDIPEVTSDVIEAIRTAARADEARKTEAREQKAQQYKRAGLLQQAEKERGKTSGTFLNALLKRLDKWEPLQTHWKGNCKEKPTVKRSPDQMSLFENGAANGEVTASAGEPGTSPGEVSTSDGEVSATDGEPSTSDGEPRLRQEKYNNPKSTIHNNNPNQQSKSTTITATTVAAVNGRNAAVAAASSSALLIASNSTLLIASNSTLLIASILNWMGFTGRLTPKDKNPAPAMLLAWAYWVKLNGPELKGQGKNAVGIARAGWRRGDTPGGDLVELVQLWLSLDDSGRCVLIEAGEQARFYGRLVVNRELENLGVTNTVAKIFYALWLATDGDIAPDSLMPKEDDG